MIKNVSQMFCANRQSSSCMVGRLRPTDEGQTPWYVLTNRLWIHIYAIPFRTIGTWNRVLATESIISISGLVRAHYFENWASLGHVDQSLPEWNEISSCPNLGSLLYTFRQLASFFFPCTCCFHKKQKKQNKKILDECSKLFSIATMDGLTDKQRQQ